MCGIVGARHEWLRQRGLDPESAMRTAVAALAWRGPDGQHVVRAGDWWLGCARLAIGPAGSRQPVVRRRGRFAAVMNGAITNARELWARLLPGVERRAALPNDAWLPLLAVECGQHDLLRTLRGHHAYGVVDIATGELVFGQDGYGEKPLVCLHGRRATARTLHAFASTATALAALGAPAGARPRRLGDWFRFGFHDPLPQRLPGGLAHAAVPQRGEPLRAAVDEHEWCRATSPASPAPAGGPSRTDLRRAVIDSVERCLDTRAAAALLLSGGVDSSCLAASLRALRRPTPAYQFWAEGTPPDERAVARSVAGHCGLAFRPVDGGPEVLDALPTLTAMAGRPLGDPSALAMHAVARAAARDGVRVVLGGEGADELFLGYRRYRALATLPNLRWLGCLAPRWSMRYPARWLRAATAADPALELLAVTPPAFGVEVLAATVAARRRRTAGGPRRGGVDPVPAARRQDLDGYLRLDLLPKVDVATMAAAVEARCPYLDRDVAALAASRPVLGKRELRAAFAGDLPAAVFRLPKRGFALPLDRWFRGDLPWLDLLAESRARQRPHLRGGGLAAVIDRHRSGLGNLGHGLYLLLAYELFLRAQEQESASRRTNSRTGA